QPTRCDDAGVDIDLGVRVDQGLVPLDHDGFEECQRGDRGGHALAEVDAVRLRPAFEDLPVRGFGDVLDWKVPPAVVSDRVDRDPVPLVECRPIPASEAPYSCRRLSRASRTSIYDVSTHIQPTQDLAELIGCVE